MTMVVWGIIHIIITLTVLYIYEILKRNKIGRGDIAAKCLGTFVAVSCALLAVAGDGGNLFTNLVLWFAVLCMASDALLEIHFISGMLLFGVAHTVLIIYLIGIGGFHWTVLLVWVALLTAMAAALKNKLLHLGSKAIPYLIYGAFLSFMCSVSLVLPFYAGGKYAFISFGAVIFVFSDFLVGKVHFSQKPVKWQCLIMPLYWGALFFITFSLWLP